LAGELTARLERLAGVRSVAFARTLPGAQAERLEVQVADGARRAVVTNEVSPGFFATLRTSSGALVTIVGVAGDVAWHHVGLLGDPVVYVPWSPVTGSYQTFVRFEGDAASMVRPAAAALRTAYPDALVEARPFQSLLDAEVTRIWQMEVLVLILGAVAATVAIVGCTVSPRST
jgi:hypothetical protein